MIKDDLTENTVGAINGSIKARDVIEHYTGQRAINNAYLCPFHKDRRPSLTAKGIVWNCWACGARGDAIGFVTRYFTISFADAVKMISSDFGITIPTPTGSREPESFEALGDRIVRTANRRNREQLREAIDYRIKELNEQHRELMHNGAPDEVLSEIAADLDWLILEYDKI